MKRLLLILAVLFATNAFATTELLRYVNTNSDGIGCDGTTNGTTGAGCAYNTLAAWEAATNKDLVASDEYAKVIVSGTVADTTTVDIDGWTTGEDNYILITCDPAISNSCHSGVWDATKYHIESATADVAAIRCAEDYVRFNGFQIKKSSSSTGLRSGIRVTSVGDGDIQVTNMIFWGVSDNGTTHIVCGLRLSDVSPTYHVDNCVFYGFLGTGSFGISLENLNPPAYIYNNTFYGNDIDMEANTNTRIKNCIFQSNVTNDVLETGTPHADSYWNVSDRASCPGSVGTGTVNFVNAGAQNFHLNTADTLANNKGQALTCDINWVAGSVDFERGYRTPNCILVWDIGADETACCT